MKALKKSILILAGLPGVGKTTLIEELSKVTDVLSFSTDLIRKEVLGEKRPTIKGTGLAYEELIGMLGEYSGSESRLVVIDTTSMPKYDAKNEGLLIGVTKIAKKYSRDLVKIALIATADLIQERLDKRAKRDIDAESQKAYLKRYFEIDSNFSRNLPMGSNWNFIETTNRNTREVTSEVLKVLASGDNLNIKLYKEINGVKGQMYSDLFDSDMLEKWVKLTPKTNNSLMANGKWHYDSNGLINIYETILKIIESQDKENSITKNFFAFVNMPLKDDCYFLPEWGTTLRNTTAFCLKVIGRYKDAKKISPHLRRIPNNVKVIVGSLQSSIIFYEAKLYVVEFPSGKVKINFKLYIFTIINEGTEKLFCVDFPSKSRQNINFIPGLELHITLFDAIFSVK